MSKLHLDHIEFYITNVCNLTCTNCRSFNNFKFSGHYEYNQELVQAWANKVDIDTIAILGGEPVFHPNLSAWIFGIRQAWPNAKLTLITNGTRLSQVKDLHQILASTNCTLSISSHGYNLRKTIAEEMFTAFGACEVLPIELSNIFGIVNTVSFRTSLGVRINLQNGNSLQDICFTDSKFTLRKSDPAKAHDACAIKYCHHMIDYKIYKCSVLGLLPSFLKQQNANLEQLQSYDGIDIDSVTQESLDKLKQPLPHCSVCPESNEYKPIISMFKKDLKSNRDSQVLPNETAA